ncbi:catechol 2,3-dioxygenase-like lactoylglutathione lyase family enzyme [Alteromonadaceae bacterium 2753L.S.0a.02]|nr:catechol 2,3-dioxygenase-like lactoylglutathione lyase family enzyme [Alteromonadaceae bacterium 2753L.S.0a.02]
MEISGIAHIQITVNDLQQAMPFYESVLGFMGMQPVVKAPNGLYMIGGKTAVALTRSSSAHRETPFDQRRIGLHHLCFRAKAAEDIDALYEFLVEKGVTIVHPPEEGDWAPGYYSLLFEDPEGIRLEVNFVPGKGHFANLEQLPLKTLPGYEHYPE